jgi:periplasmic protein TonB
MSYVSQTQRANPVGLTAAVAINGGLIAAIMLISVTVAPNKKVPDTKVINVENTPVPPEIKEEVKTDKPVIPPIYTPDPVIKLKTPQPDMTVTNKLPEAPILPEAGSLGETPQIAAAVIPPVIKPVPVPPVPIFKSAQRDARFMRNFQPDYPLGMLQREIEGNVTIKVLIGPDGRVRQATILSAATPEFGAATQKQALKEWRFKPATRDGQPVEDWQTLTVTFKIT